MKYVVRIQSFNRSGNRVKEGDVISIRPYKGNPIELDNGSKGSLCVISLLVDNLNSEEVSLLSEAEYTNGKHQSEVDAIYDDLLEAYENGEIVIKPEYPIASKKRRYNIPLNIIKQGWFLNLNINKLRDPNSDYQPSTIEVNASEQVAFCKDKYTNKFKYSTIKELII